MEKNPHEHVQLQVAMQCASMIIDNERKGFASETPPGGFSTPTKENGGNRRQ